MLNYFLLFIGNNIISRYWKKNTSAIRETSISRHIVYPIEAPIKSGESIHRFELSNHHISYCKVFWQISYRWDTLMRCVLNWSRRVRLKFNSTKTLKPDFAKYAVEANLFQLGSTNRKKNSRSLDAFFCIRIVDLLT